MLIALLALSSFALGADLVTPSITTVREATGLGTLAVVMSCGDSTDSDALADALKARKDIDGLVRINNASPNDILVGLHSKVLSLHGGQFHRLLFTIDNCSVTKGDEDDEEGVTGGGTLRYADLMNEIKPLAESTVLVLDTSRTSYGFTADDAVRLGLVDVFVISGAPNKTMERGVIPALTATLIASNGELMTLDDFYFKGIKAHATDLDLYTSLGISPTDQWNKGRQVFPGGGLIAPPTVAELLTPSTLSPVVAHTDIPVTTSLDTKPRSKLSPGGLSVLGAGALLGVSSGILAGMAADHRSDLEAYNNGLATPPSDDALNLADRQFHTDATLAIVLGSAGSLALVAGGIWTFAF